MKMPLLQRLLPKLPILLLVVNLLQLLRVLVGPPTLLSVVNSLLLLLVNILLLSPLLPHLLRRAKHLLVRLRLIRLRPLRKRLLHQLRRS